MWPNFGTSRRSDTTRQLNVDFQNPDVCTRTESSHLDLSASSSRLFLSPGSSSRRFLVLPLRPSSSSTELNSSSPSPSRLPELDACLRCPKGAIISFPPESPVSSCSLAAGPDSVSGARDRVRPKLDGWKVGTRLLGPPSEVASSESEIVSKSEEEGEVMPAQLERS